MYRFAPTTGSLDQGDNSYFNLSTLIHSIYLLFKHKSFFLVKQLWSIVKKRMLIIRSVCYNIFDVLGGSL